MFWGKRSWRGKEEGYNENTAFMYGILKIKMMGTQRIMERLEKEIEINLKSLRKEELPRQANQEEQP